MIPPAVLWTVVIASATFVVSLVAVAFLLVRLPATYFLDRHHRDSWIDRHPLLRWLMLIAKNLLGGVLVCIGILMLFTPGQGVLTMLIGIMLMDFPGKRALERKLVNRHGIQKAINRLRAWPTPFRLG